MKLRTKFIVVFGMLHLLVLVLSFYIFKDNEVWFIITELVLFVSIVLTWQLYKQMLQPLQTLVTGMEAIKDKDFNVKFLQTGTYEMDQLIEVYNQMMDQLKTERTRQEQQHFFLEKLIQTSPIGILILDFDGLVQQVNPKACAIFDRKEEELLKQPIANIKQPLFQAISTLELGEARTVTLDGIHTYKLQRSHFIDRGFPRSFVLMEELTAEILAAEKNAYGKVIRMMAHEVNNTIGPVNSILDSALKTNDLWTKEHQTLNHALQVAYERNQNLNIFMRNFAEVVRLPLPHKVSLDLNQLLKQVVLLFDYKAAEAGIQFLLQIPENPFTIYADQQQLEQALINIIKNSMEAIEGSGEIVISTNPQERKLYIIDSGSGISNQQAAQLFSPFFSTKKNGQGVGLTLVKEILLNHGYGFSLKTVDVGKTVFEIELDDRKQ